MCRFDGEKTCWGETIGEGERMLRMREFFLILLSGASLFCWEACVFTEGWRWLGVRENKKERVVVFWGQKCGERQRKKRDSHFVLKKINFFCFLSVFCRISFS